MNIDFITLTKDNIEKEHICCAFSDKKCQESYNLKKEWLKRRFENGYVFRRLNERAKVFIEYGPAENGWVPVKADNYLLINCFWVAGQYKGKGYAKALLQTAIDDALQQGKDGLVTVVGTKKFHFMSDTKWLLRQGFVACEQLPTGFSLLVKKLNVDAPNPTFNESARTGECLIKRYHCLFLQPLSVCRISCDEFFEGNRCQKKSSFDDYKTGDNGAGTGCTYSGYDIQLVL